jgi:hypothetical protein
VSDLDALKKTSAALQAGRESANAFAATPRSYEARQLMAAVLSTQLNALSRLREQLLAQPSTPSTRRPK